MSCNGCRVLRKGCSDTCILRSCLQWIESPEAQGHATVFVAKFFGRAGMMNFINAVAEKERPALFQSLLYEACGRTVNPVFGAVGLLWSGNWAICQEAVDTVLKGGVLKPSACSPSTKLTQTLSPQKSSMNSSPTKRPQSMITEANVSSGADFKRLRSEDLSAAEQPKSRCKADVDHIVPILMPNSEHNTVVTPAFVPSSEAYKQQQGLSSCTGQLVAPVPRRVKPQAGYGFAALATREHQRICAGQKRPSHEAATVELDLSLNSQALTSPMPMPIPSKTSRAESPVAAAKSSMGHVSYQRSLCNEEENAACLGAVRVSSPLSMNSEGSVISSDSVEHFQPSCVRVYRSSTSRDEEFQLLHLL